ncbi:hypothetical protein [Candidatus Contubernalis alkaliaceticus]|uniref:hypothetical protein n=1 Tax=Candidatus Contubernalis alkaliaceticus TaxID=338645 RepID=UPI001F4C1094|nr:hypothetical protein [Candidatus Contubernalis alkalaceticus]UNC91984.1 hypothetical protein HUE98_07660 [Candidatus Contubernalis alkalaceticus]
MQLVQFALIAFVALPVDGPFFWARFLPGTLASHLVREVMVTEIRILHFPPVILLTTAIVGLIYLFGGWFVFKQCEQKAMKDGRLAHY